jgi:hypothetical protein
LLAATPREKETLIPLAADMSDQGVLQTDGLFVDGQGAQLFEISFCSSVEIGHDERNLVPARVERSRPGMAGS